MTDSEMLWGGRFAGGPAAEMLELTSSIDVDFVLLEHDLAATKAHARALVAAGLLGEADLISLDEACDRVPDLIVDGKAAPIASDEDVHTFVERVLTEELGELGARIHAGRSRNDLVATDLRLWCRQQAVSLQRAAADLIEELASRAENETETLMPGYTHLQRAQPVSLGFHLLAHGFALTRDAGRFAAARVSADVGILGAGALAGNTLGLDPEIVAEELGFAGVFDNAMDAVSDRDFVCDLVYACALCSIHLSRFAEEVVLWTSSEFGFARLDDEWSTGSSMMPQKRNPDLGELLRGRSAATLGELVGILTLLKGLPLAYDRDLQEDKGLVFAAVARTEVGLRAASRLVAALRFDRDALAAAAASGGAWATDLAERLVSRGVAFREAHEIVGKLVARLESERKDLGEVSADELRSLHPAFADEPI